LASIKAIATTLSGICLFGGQVAASGQYRITTARLGTRRQVMAVNDDAPGQRALPPCGSLPTPAADKFLAATEASAIGCADA
jgi:hypothetical protein